MKLAINIPSNLPHNIDRLIKEANRLKVQIDIASNNCGYGDYEDKWCRVKDYGDFLVPSMYGLRGDFHRWIEPATHYLMADCGFVFPESLDFIAGDVHSISKRLNYDKYMISYGGTLGSNHHGSRVVLAPRVMYAMSRGILYTHATALEVFRQPHYAGGFEEGLIATEAVLNGQSIMFRRLKSPIKHPIPTMSARRETQSFIHDRDVWLAGGMGRVGEMFNDPLWRVPLDFSSDNVRGKSRPDAGQPYFSQQPRNASKLSRLLFTIDELRKFHRPTGEEPNFLHGFTLEEKIHLSCIKSVK